MQLENNPMRKEYCDAIGRIEAEIAFIDLRLNIWSQPDAQYAVLHQSKAAYLAALAQAYWPARGNE